MASRGASAAARAAAAGRRPDERQRNRPNIQGVRRGICADASATRLAGGAESSHRLALAWRRPGTHWCSRGGVGGADPRCDAGLRQCKLGRIAADDPQHKDRLRTGLRSGCSGIRFEPGAAGREHHRVFRVRAVYGRQMARSSQAGIARPESRCRHLQSRYVSSVQAVRARHRGRGVVSRGRSGCSSRPRHRRLRAFDRELLAEAERRSDLSGRPIDRLPR